MLNYTQDDGIEIQHSSFICNYYGDLIDVNESDFEQVDYTNIQIQNILNIVGLKPNFEVRQASIPNAAAVVHKGKRYILYNTTFMNQLRSATGNSWTSVSILAHEIGHHLNGHTLLASGSRPEIELEADEFSGFVLRKMGATLKDAQSAMQYASSLKASHTHPAKAERLNAIASGWNNADAQMAGKKIPPKTNSNAEVPVTIKKSPKNEPQVLAEKYIAYDVRFSADPKGKYYVTIRNNLVKVENGKLYIAGVMAKSNKKNYPAMFYDKQYNYLYITNDLAVVNGSGKKVGAMSSH